MENELFKNLKVLDISRNRISDINILTKVKFTELKELDLGQNEIDIKARKS